MEKGICEFICDYCKEPFYLTRSNYAKRNRTRQRTGYASTVCSHPECRKKQRQEVIKVMHNRNIKNHTWEKNGKFRKGKSFEDLWGEEKAVLAKEKIKKARLLQPEPHLGHKASAKSRKKMSESRKKFLKNNPIYSKIHGDFMARRYMSLPPEEKLKYSMRGHEIGSHIKRYTNHGKMLTWYGEEVWYESDYERIYFEMLNQQKIYWKKNTTLLVHYYDSKYECLKLTKPDVLLYTENFEHLHTIVEIKPYDFLLNPKNKKSRYYQVTKDKHDGLVGYAEYSNLKVQFITELDLLPTASLRDIRSFKHRKKEAQAYESNYHLIKNIYHYNRPYFNNMRRFEVDGYIINS